jgi:hypothetical protein
MVTAWSRVIPEKAVTPVRPDLATFVPGDKNRESYGG